MFMGLVGSKSVIRTPRDICGPVPGVGGKGGGGGGRGCPRGRSADCELGVE